jgi:metal-responsive CopG/Arc/MetJ family transcriptional regulator
MEDKETDARLVTMTKSTWRKLDSMAEKYGYMNAQEIIRQSVAAMLKGEEKEVKVSQ